MASSVSQLNNYTNFSLFSFDNKDLLMKGMLMKQNAIDQNRAKLQQMRDEVANFSVAKDVDKKYLEERLVQTTDIINRYSAGDLSNPNLMNQLASKFEEVVDDKVLNAIASTSTIIQEDKQWESKRGTAEYNELNHQHAMQNRMKYLQDNSVGTQYSGGGGFQKYTDIDAIYTSKEFQEFLDKSNIRAEYVRNEDGSGYFRALNKYEGVDAPRLQEAIGAFLGEDGRKQLQINAWGKYGNATSEENILRVKNDYESIVNSDITSTEKQLDAIETALEGDKLSAEERVGYEQKQQQLEQRVTSLRARDFNSMITNPDGSVNEGAFKNVYTSIYEQEFMTDKFNLLYHDPILKDSKIDEVQFKTAEFLESKRMNDLAVQRENRLAQKDMWEMQGKPVLDANGNPVLMSDGTSTGSMTNSGIMMRGQDAVVNETEANDITLLDAYQKDYKTVVNNIRLDQKNNWDENSTIALEKWLIGNDLAINDVFKLSTGRTIKVTADNIVHLEKLKAMTSKDNGTLRKLRGELRDFQRAFNSDLDRQYKEDPNKFRNADLKDFYYQEINGKLVYKEGKLPQAKGNNFNYLMDKKANGGKLTKAEERTLGLYKVNLTMNDKDLGAVEKEQAYRAYKLDLDPSTAVSLPTFNKFAEGVIKYDKKKVSPASIGYPTLSVNGNLVEVTKEEYDMLNEKSVRGLPQYKGGTPQTSSKIYVREGDYNNIFKNIDVKKGDYFTAYKEKRDATLESARQVINKTQFTILPESTSSNKQQQIADKATREAIRSRLNIPSDYKGDIRFERIIKDAKPTDEFNVFTDYKEKEGDVSVTKTDSKTPINTIKLKDLQAFNLPLDEGIFTPFDASMGNEAENLSVKASSLLYNKTAIRKGSTNASEVFSEGAKQHFEGLQVAMRTRLKQPDFDLFKELSNPAYQNVNLSYRAIDGVYYLVDQDGEQVSLQSDGYSGRYGKLKDEDVVRIKTASDALLLEYIEKKVLNKYNLN